MKKTKRGCYGKGGMAMLDQAPELLGGIFQALQGLEGMNDQYSSQPLVNAQTVRNMKTPYSTSMAFGGTIDDLTDEEYAMLEQNAEQAGMSAEDMFDAISAQEGPGDDEEEELVPDDEEAEGDNNYMPEEDEEEQYVPEEEYAPEDEEEEDNQLGQVFATGGKAKKHWIQGAVNPKHKGYCTPMTKSTCTPRRKALARTFKKHHGFHAMGGYTEDPTMVKRRIPKVPVGLTPLAPSLLGFVLPGGGLEKIGSTAKQYAGNAANQAVKSNLSYLPFSEELLSGYEKAKQYYNTSPRLQKFVRNSFADGGQVPPKKKTNYFQTNKRAYVDSTLNANKGLDWVQRLREENTPTIQIPGQPYPSTHFMGDDGQGYVFPTVVRKPRSKALEYLGDDAEAYARRTGTGIQFPKEQGTWFANNGYKRGTGVLKGYATGGQVPIEVEDDEIVQTPDGEAQQMSGPSHEEGGIDMNVPAGTRIYSDRLSIDGKTMQERKAARLRSLKRASQGLKYNPLDPTAKNSASRTQETSAAEEAQDMALQEYANKIYAAPGQAMGGRIKERKYDDGGMVKYRRNPYAGPFNTPLGSEEISNWTNDLMGIDAPLPTRSVTTPFKADYINYTRPTAASLAPKTGIRTIDPKLLATRNNPGLSTPRVIEPEEYDSPYSIGDYVGLAGNAFNAIAPLVNTRNAMKATKPNRNRFQSFGREALDTNEYAQSQVNAMENADFGELETSTNTARAGNRNSARSVNTIRALDAITNTQRNKARAAISAGAAGRRIGLLGQRSQLQNVRDNAVMRAAAMRDEADKQDVDNYYSNIAANLTNLGTNVQGIGKNLNTTRRNEDQMAMMRLLNKYGVGLRRKKGKLVMTNT